MMSGREEYILSLFQPEDSVLRDVREVIRKRGMPDISVHPLVGAFLTFLARVHGSRDILEIGALGGYSAVCLARALPRDGHVVSLDINPDYIAVARANLHHAGLENRVTHVVGAAENSLDSLIGEGKRFDFVLIDADKENYPVYLEKTLEILRPGGVIAADNTLWRDEVWDPAVKGKTVEALRRFNDMVARHPRLESLLWPVADGLTLARYRGRV
ncbi:MAG: O-methyltransferase [Firmicutes bacterium]|uniref:O-methyltransferase n=1 Tax=Sulfobacillus benefaciens TaxID=453960 RepID=A0A2T2WS03_9FIRM|nr:O-methyltransferase [Bacillota bacterium]PSR25017.1 MAG: O-methyltransferase [Sulfobacillus benefaciens]